MKERAQLPANHQEPRERPGAGREAGSTLSPRASRRTSPASPLISYFQPPEPGENTSLLVKPSVCCRVTAALGKTHTQSLELHRCLWASLSLFPNGPSCELVVGPLPTETQPLGSS